VSRGFHRLGIFLAAILCLLVVSLMRRFPTPWTVEAIDAGFKVYDANGHSLAYVYGRETGADTAYVLTMDEARRIAEALSGATALFSGWSLDRRDLVWINVTANPTAEWIARQITGAFPWDDAPQHLIRDRDRIYGTVVTRRLRAMGIRDKPTAPASPWQNGFAERLIGSIRRECVDHFVVLGEAHLRRILRDYARYYNDIRTHRSLDKDAPVSRPVQRTGTIRSHAILGGLHHHYVRV